jgi:hypothetical protein
MTTQTAGRQPDGQPKHRDTAAEHLSEASDYLNGGAPSSWPKRTLSSPSVTHSLTSRKTASKSSADH